MGANKAICAWCEPGVDAPGVSHGICALHAAEKFGGECAACGADADQLYPEGTEFVCEACADATEQAELAQRMIDFAECDRHAFERAHGVGS